MAIFLSRVRKNRICQSDVSRRGSFTLEFALLGIPFFLLMMGVVELCLMEGAQQMLENAAFNTSRLAKTGYKEQGKTQDQIINQILINELSSYGVLIDTTHVTMTEFSYADFAGAAAGGGTAGYGTEQQVVAYTIAYPWKLFTPLLCSAMGSACQTGNIVNLKSTIVVRNEPYG